jgi:hypothetical protein
MEILNKIQKELKAPKNQKNNFGNYNYRSCEDILEAVKPLLGKAILTLSDKLVNIGDRYYVKAIATIRLGEEKIFAEGYARETLDRKGMDASQITGSASSYARKYALNGLFLIDDTKDSDSQDNSKKPLPKKPTPTPPKEKTDKEIIIRLVKKLKPEIKNNEYAQFVIDKTKEELLPKNFKNIISKLNVLVDDAEEIKKADELSK